MDKFQLLRDHILGQKELILIGPFFDKEFHLQELSAESIVIYVDRGADFQGVIHAVYPDIKGLAIGDGDSSTVKMDVEVSSQKEQSDLALALHNISEDCESLKLLGFLGGRRDHELINFGECFHALINLKTLKKIFFDDQVSMHQKGKSYHQHEGTFSLLSFKDNQLTITGKVKYPLNQKEVSVLSSLSLSNESWGEFLIESHWPYLLIKS